MADTRIAGVVLAAGRSQRMGVPKPRLETGGMTFLERSVATLRAAGCAPVLAVVGPDDDARDFALRTDARPVVNSEARSEQIDSLRLALHALGQEGEKGEDRVGAAAVLPVDHPLVRPETVAALVARWRGAPDRIVRPVHHGEPGHPTVFPRTVWPALMSPQPEGARSVVEHGPAATEDVAVDDAGVVADIDTPEAYERWVAGA